MRKKKNKLFGSKLQIYLIAFFSIILIVAFVITLGGGNKASKSKWGIDISAYGSLFNDDGESKLKIKKQKDELTLTYVASCGYIANGEKCEEGFVFDITGAPEIAVITDTTVKARNIFLKSGTYGQMTRVDISEESFVENTYYYSPDGETFELEFSYDKKRAKNYYVLQELVSLEYDYYPIVFNLNSEDNIEGLKYNGYETINGLNRISQLIANAMGKMSTVTDSNQPYTTVFCSQGDLAIGTDLKSWIKFTNEELTWEHRTHNKNDTEGQVDEVMNLLAEENDSIIVKYDDSFNEKPKTAITVVAEQDYCLDMAFELQITFKPKETT